MFVKTDRPGSEDCAVRVVHRDVVDRVASRMPAVDTLMDAADFFRVLADSTRMQILQALFIAEMCVCDIASLMSVSRSAVSHQLRTLKQANIVRARRVGKTVYYRLSDDHVKAIVDQALIHTGERTP
jgi:ArsR family transcriptional regulator, lead/cadmium/zinc/bismuth-responsive transcriptional repressor